MSDFIFEAQARKELGKGASRRLRRQGQIPAIVYGGDSDAVSIILEHHKVIHQFKSDDVYSSILTVNIDGKKESVVLRNVQRHPFKPFIQHLDFLRVKANEKLTQSIPVHLLNAEKAAGVKEGGVLSRPITTVEVSCLPKHLPASIDFDVAKLELGHIITVADIPAIPHVEFLTHAEEVIATILHPQSEVAEETEGAAAEGEAKE